MDTQAIGRLLTELREKRGWSRDEVGARAGLHPNTVRNVELGAESMQLRTLEALANIFDLGVEQLLKQAARPRRRRQAS